jgi:serine/threonine-protein kinase RsbW
MTENRSLVRLKIHSIFEMLDLVQLVSDRLSQMAGLDEDTVHWVGVAVRESVINAMKHGNRLDEAKMVTVEFSFVPAQTPTEFIVSVIDQGEGFEEETVADPLAPENLLKSSGRGIFFMRNFMDDVVLRKIPEGGMEVRMVKKLSASPHL